MQDHLERTQYGSSGTVVFQLSLVASLLDCLINLISIAAQILLSRFGLKRVMFASAILCSLSLELASLNTQVWHLILCIGVVFGCGSSIFFYVSTALIPQWFDTRQGISLGIVSSGGSVAGLVLPFFMTGLNRTLGSAWCFRMLGFMSLVIFGSSSFLLKEQAQKGEKRQLKQIVDFSVLKNKNLLIWCAANIVIEAGYFVPSFYIPSHATSLGMSETQSSLLVTLLCAFNAMGRILAGHLGDKIGYINITIIGCIIACVSSLVLWVLAYDLGMLAAFCCTYGASAGVFAALGPSITKLIEKDRFESAYTMFLILCAVAYFGLNIATVIQTSTNAPYFLTCKIFTGITYFVGALILLYLKSRLGSFFARM